MSLRIAADKVERVLLSPNGWVRVAPGSFYLDSYEFVETDEDDTEMLLNGGQEKLVPATGFAFIGAQTKHRYFGPLTSILAVECSPVRRTDPRGNR